MSRLRSVLVLVVLVVSALAPFASADVQLRKSEIVHCPECWGRWADFNGDGLDDFLDRNRLYWNLGGRLAESFELQDIGWTDQVIRTADFNDDGIADLLTHTGENPNEQTHMWIGVGNGRFTEHPMPAGSGLIVHAADFTNDGTLDLLRFNVPEKELVILKGKGDATFTHYQKLAWPYDKIYNGTTTADINGDGKLDIITPYEDYLQIFFAQADGKFGDLVSRFTRFRVNGETRVADVNGDGKADMIVNEGHDGVSGITALFGDGTGRFPGVSRYVVPRPDPATTIQLGERPSPMPFWGATQSEVADFVAGGANEIAFGSVGDGSVVLLGVADGKLVELSRQDVESWYPLVAAVRFSKKQTQLLAFGQWYEPSAPRAQRLRYSHWLLEPEGAIAPQTLAPERRRGRTIGRSNGFTGGRYHVMLEGDCPLPGLRNWSLEKEGMFVNVERSGIIERGESVFLDGEMFIRLYVKDGAMTRVLEGTLKQTELGLTGKLFEWGDSPCGGRWQVHRVVASLSH